MIVDSDGFDFEVNAYGCNIVLFKLIVTEPDQNVGFSNSTVSDYNKFEKVLLFFGVIWVLFDCTHFMFEQVKFGLNWVTNYTFFEDKHDIFDLLTILSDIKLSI